MIPVHNDPIPLEIMIRESAFGNERMQLLLYRQYAPEMLTLCLRYAKSNCEAEDIMQEGFIKVFGNLDKFRGDGCFEGWIKRIMYRTAVSYFRGASKKAHYNLSELNQFMEDRQDTVLDKLGEKDIVKTLTMLPSGYRNVFTMYVIEGYSHREIADILGCSEGTCKSQLNRSRSQLQKMLQQSA
ncbi:RNA polymerase sigma factor [Ferruginibacter sp.]